MPFDHIVVAKVIVCGQRRFIIHKDQLFTCTNRSVTAQGNIIENWKCVHRMCRIRLWTCDQMFKIMSSSDVENHVHSSTASTYLSGQDYSVIQHLFSVKCGSSFVDTPPHTPPASSATRGKEIAAKNQAVDSAGSPSPPSSSPEICIINKSNPRSSICVAGSSFYIRDQRDIWSPPVLHPPSDGRPYAHCIPSHPVARIGPYPEPQVMYNPYFLWQLNTYYQNRMSPSNALQPLGPKSQDARLSDQQV